MRVFVTGATGWVGSAVVDELLGAGHEVVGLSRSMEKAGPLEAKGATALVATLDDLQTLQNAAREADAVAHLAFNHDFSKFAENGAQDARAIEAFGAVLDGRPLLVTSGVAMLAKGRAATEDDQPVADPSLPRRSDATAARLREAGARVASVRLSPSTHSLGGDHGFVEMLARLARQTGVSAYVGEGENRWPGVHRTDAARVYRLALETGVTETAYHAVAEEGVPFKDIAAAIGGALNLPVEPRPVEHFGWFGHFAAADMTASSAKTRAVLDWTPTGPTLLEDIRQPAYYSV